MPSVGSISVVYRALKSLNEFPITRAGKLNSSKRQNHLFVIIIIFKGLVTELNTNERTRGSVTLFTNNARGGSNVHLQLDDWPAAMIALPSAHAHHTRKRKGWLSFFQTWKDFLEVSSALFIFSLSFSARTQQLYFTTQFIFVLICFSEPTHTRSMRRNGVWSRNARPDLGLSVNFWAKSRVLVAGLMRCHLSTMYF